MSEEEVIEIFQRQGQVLGFRLVYDKETSKPKGYGFLEYADPECASAAVRNLNEFPIQGRTLRVDWSSNNSIGGDRPGDIVVPAQTAQHIDTSSALPPLPPGMPSNTIAAPDAISKTLSAMPAHQLLDIISQMKGMVTDNPAQVTELFRAAPQLAYAIFQALLVLGLVDIGVLGSIVQATTAAPQAAPPVMPVQQPAPPQYGQIPPPYPHYGHQHVPTPPVQHMPYQPPPQQQAYPPPVQPLNQDALIRQIMAMTPEQIYALPADQRDQLIALRAQFGQPLY